MFERWGKGKTLAGQTAKAPKTQVTGFDDTLKGRNRGFRKRSKQATKSMDVISAEERVQHFSDAVLDCRDVGHAWRRLGLQFTDQNRLVERRWECLRCPTIRLERIVRNTGQMMYRRYAYPAEYLSRGNGRIHRDTVRRESIRRAWSELVRKG